MEVVPFKKEHLDSLIETGITDEKYKAFLTPEDGPRLERLDDTYTLLGDDNLPIVIGGIRMFWLNRAEAWVLISKNVQKKDFVRVHKTVQKFIDLSPYRRIEMVVDLEFEAGHRWARTLGFKKEAEVMKAYRQDGGDTTLYARVKS